jgi:hypothetical protein
MVTIGLYRVKYKENRSVFHNFFCTYLYTGWSKMYLPSLNTIFSATSDYNLKKLCWRTVVPKPFVYHLFSFDSVQNRAADIHHRRVHSIIWKSRKGQNSVPGKIWRQSWTGQAHSFKPRQEISQGRISFGRSLSKRQAFNSKDWNQYSKSSRANTLNTS